MNRIVVFGGTREGRKLAGYLEGSGVSVHMCVATEYGESILPKGDNIHICAKRLNRIEMEEYLLTHQPEYVIDATHPYAVEVTDNIIEACKETGFSYIRLIREENSTAEEADIIHVPDIESAVAYLKHKEGNILITTGSKELNKYTLLDNYRERCYARVLSVASVVEECSKIGFEGKNLFCMQGPFSEEFNYVQIRMIHAAYVVTKSSGTNGGFLEKYRAAMRAGVKLVVIGRPVESKVKTDSMSYREVLVFLREKYGVLPKQKVTLIGMGMGNKNHLTYEAVKALEESDVIIGASRMLTLCRSIVSHKEFYSSYTKEEIVRFIKAHPEYTNIAIAFSGDVGFSSGAKGLSSLLDSCQITAVSGISTPVYFLNKIGVPWEDTLFLSKHGKELNIVSKVRNNEKICVLLGSTSDVSEICHKLLEYGMENLDITVGEKLSYPEEKILTGKPKDFANQVTENLAVIYIENISAGHRKQRIEDEEFARGKVPMTKQEIRLISIEKLGLDKSSIVYDIGAGTGSVSVEAALQCEDGTVYAIEKNTEGISLIEENKRKFQVDNCTIIEGMAPECLEDLEVPTHVFIGGSSGKLKSIVKSVMRRNKNVRIVVNAISLDTVLEIMRLVKEGIIKEPDIIQANISRSRKTGNYHMMQAYNPVYIVSFGGGNRNG